MDLRLEGVRAGGGRDWRYCSWRNRPYGIRTKLILELIDQMTGLIDHASLETRVALVWELVEGIDVGGVEQRAVAGWNAPSDRDVDRLESVTEWLRRAGAGRLLTARGDGPTMITLPQVRAFAPEVGVHHGRVCAQCHQTVPRTSPVQRDCAACRKIVERSRSKEAMRRRRVRP